jgi:hypothetical protein
MAEVGLVLDVAERAEALGDDFATWADLPQQVIMPGISGCLRLEILGPWWWRCPPVTTSKERVTVGI